MEDPNFQDILKSKRDYYGHTEAAIEFAAEEYTRQHMQTTEFFIEDEPKPLAVEVRLEAKDLTIGNYVFGYTFKHPIAIRADHIQALEVGAGKEYSPIPLTPEWLAKCGFNKGRYHPNSVHEKLDSTVYCLFSYDDGYKFEDFEGHEMHYYYIKYVHQLQNFFHVITGEELQISL